MDEKYRKPTQGTKPGVYLLGRTIVVNAEDYLASKPNMGLRMSETLTRQLRTPTEEERLLLSEDDSTLVWLTLQAQRGPKVRRVVNDFLGIN